MPFIPGSERTTPVFHLGYDRKDLALQVNVSNKGGDDAYEAKLVANFPGVLSYSGVRSPTAVRGIADTLLPPGGSSAHHRLPHYLVSALTTG